MSQMQKTTSKKREIGAGEIIRVKKGRLVWYDPPIPDTDLLVVGDIFWDGHRCIQAIRADRLDAHNPKIWSIGHSHIEGVEE